MTPSPSPDLAGIPPLRAGLFQVEPPRLLGSSCSACGTSAFPARSFCPACFSGEPVQPAVLSDTGTVFSYTVVRQAPGKRPTPYALAYVDLEDGVRVLAQIDHDTQALTIGMPVKLVIRRVHTDDGEPRLGFAFAATGQKTGDL